MESAFQPWIGQSVVVQVALGRVKLSLRGTVLEERQEFLLVKPEAGAEVDVPKAMVLAIEESRRSSILRSPVYSEIPVSLAS